MIHLILFQIIEPLLVMIINKVHNLYFTLGDVLSMDFDKYIMTLAYDI